MRLVIVSVLALAAVGGKASADPPLDASMTCASAPGPGRVRCDAEVRAPPGSRIAWADVVIVEAPAHVAPLKARIPPSDATESRDASWRWGLAVVAKERGKGELKARVRAVVCTGDACAPMTRDLAVVVAAGE